MSKGDEREILHYVRIVSGNRVTLPEDVRQALEIKEGDYLRAEVKIGERTTVLSPAS